MSGDWANGKAYEPYVGRWSRLVAAEFLDWLDAPAHKRWIDFGCGTGALTSAILSRARPESILGIDPSPEYIALATENNLDPRARFEVGEATNLSPSSAHVLVSGLVLNFLPDPASALALMRRALVEGTGGIVAAYVWDYSDKMELMRYFWDAAIALDSGARDIDEGKRFPICRPDALTTLWQEAGLSQVTTSAIDVPTLFRDFDDYWKPFLGGQGPAPSYALSLSEERRDALRDRIRSQLPVSADGSIHLIARAWAVQGRSA